MWSSASISATAAPAERKPIASAARLMDNFLMRRTSGGVRAIRSARLSTQSMSWSAATLWLAQPHSTAVFPSILLPGTNAISLARLAPTSGTQRGAT
ncbi:hypothetical protein D3C85_1690500 [compost metagenome]